MEINKIIFHLIALICSVLSSSMLHIIDLLDSIDIFVRSLLRLSQSNSFGWTIRSLC